MIECMFMYCASLKYTDNCDRPSYFFDEHLWSYFITVLNPHASTLFLFSKRPFFVSTLSSQVAQTFTQDCQ